MVEARLPDDEEQRLAALEAYGILDTRTEEAFDAIARIASRLCQTPIALVTLVDEERQWFKACVGTEERETDRSVSFCAHAILEPEEVTYVPDAREDDRFLENPQVTGLPGYRFYAGAPIVTPDGHALGTVCVLDHEPRTLDADQLESLDDLADHAATLIEERYGSASMERDRAFLASILDALPDHIAILDDGGRIVATNEAWDRFARESGGEPSPGGDYLEAARAGAMEGDASAEEATAKLKALLSEKIEAFELEYPCPGPDEQRWFRMAATTFEDQGQKWAVVAHQDVTAVKAARRAIEASEERFREMLEHLDAVSWLVSPDLDEAYYVSPAFEVLFERSRDAFLKHPRDFLDWIHPEDRQRVLEALADIEEGAQDLRYRILRPDGSVRRVESRGFPVRDEHGQLHRVAGITRDVTEEEQARDLDRHRTRERARAIELEQLVFATSHTLRTEIRRIKSFGQMLKQRMGEDLDERLAEPIEEMLAGSEALETLHDALREYGEATRGRGLPEVVELHRVAREVLAERSSELEGPGGQASVAEIPPVEGDPEQLRTLVAELVDNAIKFRGEPPLELAISAHDRGETIEVQVRDNGIGFDPAYAETIFGIFQQLDPGSTEGVGIGLTICRRIVENHGGTIHAHAEPGRGATFTFTLPAAGDRQAGEPAT